MKKRTIAMSVFSIGLLAALSAVTFSCGENKSPQPDELVGAWKGKVQVKTGALAEIKEFELYVGL